MKHVNSLVLFFLVYSSASFALTAPFGIELGHSSIREVKKQFLVRSVRVDPNTHGQILYLDVANVDLEGLLGIRVMFDEHDIAQALLTCFNRQKYDVLLSVLTEKYALLEKKTNQQGVRSHVFSNEKAMIWLAQPALGSVMTLTYVNQPLLNSIKPPLSKDGLKRISAVHRLL